MADRNQRSLDQGVSLIKVYPDNEADTDIDIIAVHGLDTKSPDTWTWVDRRNPKININWLQHPDMLPKKFPTARIFTIDWTASLFKERSTIDLTITELARSLLLSIQCRPGADESRPILFVASCLGGIILIQAIVLAARSGHEYTSLWRAIGGIIFLATPFRGTAFQDIARAAVPILKGCAMLADKQVTELLHSVKTSNLFLEDLVGAFTEAYQQGDQPYELAIFYEKRKGNLLRTIPLYSPLTDILSKPKLLVDSGSARLDIVRNPIPLDRCHSLMNKFSGPDDPGYIAVTGKVAIIMHQIYNNRPIDRADAWIHNKYYTADRLKIERLSGDQLSMDQCYINLAIVEYPGYDTISSEKSKNKDTPSYSSPFSLSARLKIETPDENILVDLHTLFNLREGPDGHMIQPRRILIRGRAGVGKTTLCKKIVHDFKAHKNRKDHEDPIWNDLFDRILWIPLRNLKRKPDKGYNLEGLFLRDFFFNTPNREGLAKELEKELDATKYSRTLFVLDGLDEVSKGMDKDNEMHQFLKFLLEQPNVIITSRPSVRLSKSLRLDLELETIGFHLDQVNTYVEKAFTNPITGHINSKAAEIRFFLQDHWLIQGLVRIPIQLDALCYTWNASSLSEPTLETMTAMYQAIEHRLWMKDVLSLEKIHDGKLITEGIIQEASQTKIKRFVNDEISFLEHLAFGGLHNDMIDFGSEYRNAIGDHFAPHLLPGKTLPCLSFLRTSDSLAEDYHFLHLTYQEYFAAQYFVRQWTSNATLKYLGLETRETRRGRLVDYFQKEDSPVSYLQTHKYNARYDIFWRFVAGLLQAEGDEAQLCRFFHMIEEEPRDLLGPVHQRLVMHCLSEMSPSWETPEFSQLREHLEGQLKEWVLFECSFEFNWGKRSHLAVEMEFPEQILMDILQEETEDVNLKILNSLAVRPRIPPALMKFVAFYLGGNVSINLKRAALAVFYRIHEGLPDETIQAIAALLKDPYSGVKFAAVWALDRQWALGRQSALPNKVIQAAAALLEDPDVRWAIADSFSRQSALPNEIIQAAVTLLKNPDSYIRSAAAQVLSGKSILSNEVIQAIVDLLKDPDIDIRSTAAIALGRQSALSKEVIQAILALLKDPDSGVRSAAIQALGRQSALPNKVIQAMVVLLKDPDSGIRSAASQALGRQSALPNKVIQAVAALLKDPDSGIRSAASQALGRQSALPNKVIQAMVVLLKDPNSGIRSAASQALSRQSALPNKVIQAVAALLKDPDSDIRSTAVWTLGKQLALSKEIIQAMATLLKDPDRNVRSVIARALSRQSDLSNEIIQTMTTLLKDLNRDVRWAAAQALSRQSDLSNEIIQTMATLLKDLNRDVRWAVAEALSRQSGLSNEVIQTMATLLKDSDWDVRLAAAQALSRQSTLSNEIIQTMANLLKDLNRDVRWAAAQALSRQSTLSNEIIQTMVTLLKDPDETASQILCQQAASTDERFHYFLLKLDGQSFDDVFSDWLRRSFSNHLTWYMKGNNYSINLPEGSRSVPFDQLQSAVRRAQASLKVPISMTNQILDRPSCLL